MSKEHKNIKKEYNIRCIFIKRKYAKDISDLWKKSNCLQKLEIEKDLNLILKDKTVVKNKIFLYIQWQKLRKKKLEKNLQVKRLL